MDDVRPRGREITGLRQAISKWNREVITVDDQTFNPDFHEEIRSVARDPETANAQEKVLGNDPQP